MPKSLWQKIHYTVKCDHCDLWIHIKCNKINKQTYHLLLNNNSAWYCSLCSKMFITSTIQGKKVKFKTLSRKRCTLESTLIDNLNDAINKSDLENSSQYFLKDKYNKTFHTTDC